MTDIGMFLWHTSSAPAARLVELSKQYHIKRVVIKVLDGTLNFDADVHTDPQLIAYMDTLRAAGIIVEAWGYHYPGSPGPQGDKIEERREKLHFDTYHYNCEKEWQEDYGMPAAMKTMLSKPKVNNFEMLLCSYRSLSDHPKFPATAAMNHETTNGASPQVYWALKHNPAEQLSQCFDEYKQYGKPLYPLGAMFGATFKYRGGEAYWEPTTDDLHEFMAWCEIHHVPRVYFWSIDWLVKKGRYQWLEAVNSVEPPPIPPDPTPEDDGEFIVSSAYRNLRVVPAPQAAIVGTALRGTPLQYTEAAGEWRKVTLTAWAWKAPDEK